MKDLERTCPTIKSYFKALCAMINISFTSVWISNVSPQVGSPFLICVYIASCLANNFC